MDLFHDSVYHPCASCTASIHPYADETHNIYTPEFSTAQSTLDTNGSCDDEDLALAMVAPQMRSHQTGGARSPCNKVFAAMQGTSVHLAHFTGLPRHTCPVSSLGNSDREGDLQACLEYLQE